MKKKVIAANLASSTDRDRASTLCCKSKTGRELRLDNYLSICNIMYDRVCIYFTIKSCTIRYACNAHIMIYDSTPSSSIRITVLTKRLLTSQTSIKLKLHFKNIKFKLFHFYREDSRT